MIYLEVDLQYIPSIHHLEIPKIKKDIKYVCHSIHIQIYTMYNIFISLFSIVNPDSYQSSFPWE